MWFRRELPLVFSGLILASSVFGLGCTRSQKPATGEPPAAAPQAAGKLPGEGIKIGLVLDKGGRDDKSFNSAAFRGTQEAVKLFGVTSKEVECPDDAAFEPALRTFAERGYNLVIAIGFAQVDALKKVAPEFPKTHFAIIDGVVDSPNVASFIFSEHEAGYLVGYLAGLATKSNKIGFVGGMDIPLIRRFEMGYAAGIKAANPKTEVFSNYVGVNSSAWANPARGKELALSQYNRGADIVFHAAGASGLGVLDAAEEKKALAIGCDSNQNHLKPGRVLTSALKKVDVAVVNVIKDEVDKTFKSGARYLGVKEGGIDYAVDEHNAKLVEPFKAKMNAVREKISKGETKVPDFYETSKAK